MIAARNVVECFKLIIFFSKIQRMAPSKTWRNLLFIAYSLLFLLLAYLFIFILFCQNIIYLFMSLSFQKGTRKTREERKKTIQACHSKVNEWKSLLSLEILRYCLLPRKWMFESNHNKILLKLMTVSWLLSEWERDKKVEKWCWIFHFDRSDHLNYLARIRVGNFSSKIKKKSAF